MGTQGACAADKYQIPLWEKYLLTVKEASIYFNIGENKMHRIANEYLDSDYKFVIQNGGRTMINRKKFEDFLNNSTSI
ncbi:MAG: DNA-binding protein [Oscillospiraceae bacterium]|nr:DNA-binding protein [Oscillospiraceae bacterium]